MERIPFGEVLMSISETTEGAEVTIKVPGQTFSHFFVEPARKRGLTVEQSVGEAFRLELLFSQTLLDPDKMALIWKKGRRYFRLDSI